MAKQLYFIAIEMPEPLKTKIQEWRKDLSEEFNSRRALKSPPHITLQMPMRIEAEFESDLIMRFKSLEHCCKSNNVHFNNISAFEKRTIFIDIKPKGLVLELHDKVQKLVKSLEYVSDKIIVEHFHPHLTLMTRDLSKQQFELAYLKLKDVEMIDEVFIEHMTLYKHNGQKWKELQKVNLSN